MAAAWIIWRRLATLMGAVLGGLGLHSQMTAAREPTAHVALNTAPPRPLAGTPCWNQPRGSAGAAGGGDVPSAEVNRPVLEQLCATLARRLDLLPDMRNSTHDAGLSPPAMPAGPDGPWTDRKRSAGLQPQPDRGLLLLAGDPLRRTHRALRRSLGPAVASGPVLLTAAGRMAWAEQGGPVLMPITGNVVNPDRSFASLHKAGLEIVSAVTQTVSAPVSGRVVFAGPFRSFGLLLIIDQESGYHTLVSGLSQLDVEQGASVVAGQAIGEIVAQGNEPVRLYIELRHRGVPIDPAPWLAAREDKVRG